MPTWIIKDSEGNRINRIISSEGFVTENFEYYEEDSAANLREKQAVAINWRNDELIATDEIARVTDHPKHTEILEYRQALRDWPASENFPDNDRPVNPLN